MPLLGFKSRFTNAVENGVAVAARRSPPHEGVCVKRQTIRACRSDGRDPQRGDVLHLYVGLRTRNVRKLGEVACRKVERVHIGRRAGVRVAGKRLDAAGVRRLARADGFADADEFLRFFEQLHGLPFEGWLIRW